MENDDLNQAAYFQEETVVGLEIADNNVEGEEEDLFNPIRRIQQNGLILESEEESTPGLPKTDLTEQEYDMNQGSEHLQFLHDKVELATSNRVKSSLNLHVV